MPSSYDDLRTGYIALWAGYITEQDLRRGLDRDSNPLLAEQSQAPLGQLLVKRQKLSKYELAAVQDIALKAPAGEFIKACLAQGHLQKDPLDACCAARQQTGDEVTEAAVADLLIAGGQLTEEQVAATVRSLCDEAIKELISGPRNLELLWKMKGEAESVETSVPGESADAAERKPKVRARELSATAGVLVVLFAVPIAIVLLSMPSALSPAAISIGADAKAPLISDEPEDLVACLSHPKARTRTKALKKLAGQGAAAIPALTAALTKGDPRAIRGSIHALGLIKDRSVVSELALQIENEDWSIRCQTVDALDKIGGPEAYDAIAEALRDPVDPDPLARSLAAKALGNSGDKSHVPLLKQFKSDEDGHVAAHARRAIRALTEN